MTDLISRQDAIKEAEDLIENQRFFDVIGMLIALPSAQQWIPCSTDFPKKDGDYLVTTHNGQLARYIFNKGNSEEYWKRCVIAWMPLPEPYKGENDG